MIVRRDGEWHVFYTAAPTREDPNALREVIRVALPAGGLRPHEIEAFRDINQRVVRVRLGRSSALRSRSLTSETPDERAWRETQA